MDWSTLLIALVVVTGWLLLKRKGLANPAIARQLRQQGAPVIDVRTTSEFRHGAAPGAVHLPLDRIRTDFPARFPDRAAPVLLYCASGTRSGIAAAALRRLGYTAVHNLGGLSRASTILAPGNSSPPG